uniref:Calpain catalytic domain-containing protein n=2 Tax=Macrostomum lignano TaxID=282301 RepID=A0A1I8HCW1_9PLAT
RRMHGRAGAPSIFVDSRRSTLLGSFLCCSSDELKRASRAQLRKSRLLTAQSDDPIAETFAQKKRRQLASGELYEDPEFPAEAHSLFPNPDAAGDKSLEDFEWKRPREISLTPKFINKSMSRFDIRQGELKDCWLLAAVASLSMHRRLLERVVPSDQGFDRDYCGMFRFRFWQFGEWREVVIDDRLPTKNDRLCFMRSQEENEFWSALLEKAYAKLNGSYQALGGGNQAESMEDLTGGLCESFDLSQPPGDLLQILFQASRSHSMMGCCIEGASQQQSVLPNKLITGHAYSITDVQNVTMLDGSRQCLVRLRNPWGNEYEWAGDWGDHSPTWDRVGPAEKQRLGVEVGDDGEFWMAYEDFAREFTRLEVCRLSPEAMYDDSGASVDPRKRKRHWEMSLETGEWVANISAGGCRNFIASFHTNPQFRVEIPAPDDHQAAAQGETKLGTIIVGLMQKGVRREAGGGHFKSIGYCIYSLTSREAESGTLDQLFFRTHRFVAKSIFADLREVCSRHRLPPGYYVIIPSTFAPNEEAQFILRIFSEKPNRAETMDTCSCISCGHETGLALVAGRQSVLHAVVEQPTDQLYKAFIKFAGPPRKINARQLQQVLNVTYSKEIKSFQGFSLDTARSLLALVDVDMSGSMAYEEFKQLWGQVRQLRKVFKEFDPGSTGYFDAFKLREALKLGGLSVSNKVYHAVAVRFTDRDKGLVGFEDFVLLCTRLQIAFESFNAMPKCDEQGSVGMVNHDNYLEQAIYS